MKKEVIAAHHFCSNNKKLLQNDSVCGCFYCCEIFDPAKITEWIEGETALCPYCGIDSVIGEGSGYPIEKAFLKEMHKYWF